MTDFAAYPFSMLSGRDQLLHYDFLVPEPSLLHILHSPQQTEHFQMSLFTNVSSIIWIILFASFFIIGYLHHLEFSFIQNKKSYFYLIFNYFDLFGILLGQGNILIILQFTKITQHLLLLFILSSFILRQFFSMLIAAQLVVTPRHFFNSFSQLFNFPNTFIFIEDNSTSKRYFTKLFPALINHLKSVNHEETWSDFMVKTLSESNAVLITDRRFGEQMKRWHPEVIWHISEEGFVSSLGSYPLRKGLQKSIRDKLSWL